MEFEIIKMRNMRDMDFKNKNARLAVARVGHRATKMKD